MTSYRVISADDHVMEPQDTWQARVPQKFRARAPKVVRANDGDAWEIDGVRGRTIGLNAQAGRRFEDYRSEGETYDTIRKGSYDPYERLGDMDLDGVDAQVLFPNTGLGLLMLSDPELQALCMQSYNDFLVDFCRANPARLIGVGLLPSSIPEAAKEAHRVASLGLLGVMLPSVPHQAPFNSDVYDPLWAVLQDIGLPVHLHQGVGDRRAGVVLAGAQHLAGEADAALLEISTFGNFSAIARFIFGGVLERYPTLKIVSVEANIGWLGYFLERADRIYLRHRYWTQLELPKPPSEYFRRQVYCTFIEDRIGVKIRNDIGVDSLMWSSDYPHTDTTWPNSLKYIEEQFADVAEEDKRKIIAGNAARLYRLH